MKPLNPHVGRDTFKVQYNTCSVCVEECSTDTILIYISTYNLYRTFETAWILLNKGVTLDSGMSRLTKDHSLIYFEIGINVFIVGSVILNTIDLYLLY